MGRQHIARRCIHKAMSGRPYSVFLRNNKGATAVEFSLIAVPFLMLIFAIIEVSLVFFGGLALDNAVEEVGRQVRTGRAQAASMSATAFKDKICEHVFVIFDCKSGLQVELTTFTSFNDASNHLSNSANSPLNSSGELRDNFSFNQSSQSEEIVLLRAFYVWDITLSFPGVGLANMDNGKRLLSATTAFRNEPFQ